MSSSSVMSLFTSPHERHLWAWTLTVMVAIYSTLGLARTLAVAFGDSSLGAGLFVLGCLLILATIVTQGLKTRPTRVLLGTVIFAGLPLLGWGLTDLAGFASDPARLAYAVIVVVLQILAAVVFPGAGTGRGEGTETVRRQRVAILLLQVLSPAILIAAGYTDRRGILSIGDPQTIRYLGVLMFALGFVAVSWAEWSLGKQCSVQVTIQADHELVTDGPYRYLRHPRYLGILAFTIGISLTFNSWVALGLVVPLTIVLL